MEDSIPQVAHVVPAGVADRLEELGAETVVEFSDNLAHGPSHRKPKRHRELRLDYWYDLYEHLLDDGNAATEAVDSLHDTYLSTEQLGSVMAHHAAERRVILWTTPTLEDRLFLWFAFEAASRADVSVDRIATAEPHVAVTPEEETYFALRDLEVDELAEGFDNLVYPKEIYAQTGAQLWQTFSSSSPRKFAISVPHTEKFFPNITNLAERYGWMFPVAESEDADRVFPSRFDRTLFRAVPDDAWAPPTEILGGELVEDFPFVDDLAVAARLVDWADASEHAPYLERRVEDADGGPFGRLAFRRTARADRICEEGLGEDDDPPLLLLGDCRIYAGEPPWTKVVDGDYWWFDRFD